MLSTYIDNHYLKTCIYNASGCLCSNSSELEELLYSSTGAVLTKSSTILPRNGNILPRYFANDIGSINSMGIPNNGYQYYYQYYNINKNRYDKPFIQSIYPFDIKELSVMFDDIIKNCDTSNYMIELNLSCPNVNKKTIIGYDYEMLDSYFDYLKNNQTHKKFTIGIKLPPYYLNYDFDMTSNILLKYSGTINYITCINSVINGLIVDINSETAVISPNNGLGGIGGSYCLPTGLSNVYQFYNRLDKKINIIGCGGVNSGINVFEYILCGANAVQIGTQLCREGPNCFNRINKELEKIMIDKKYSNIIDFMGCLKII